MWLFTRKGFFSIVRKPGDTDILTVRARSHADLEALRVAYCPDLTIKEWGGTDYPFRLRVPADLMAAIVAHEVLAIDYDNFKNTQTAKRHDVYTGIWAKLLALEPPGNRINTRGWYPSTRAEFDEAFPMTPGYGSVKVKPRRRRRAKSPT